MKKATKFVSAILSTGLFVALGLSVANLGGNYSKAEAVGHYSTDPATYYQSITATSGNALLAQLHNLMGQTHKTYTTYNDCKTPEYVYAMEPGSNSNYITDFYTQKDIGYSWGAGATGTWNREHVWCQSHSIDVTTGSQLYGETYGGSDLQHLRPIESTLNSCRNNHPYGELSEWGKNRGDYKVYSKSTSKTILYHGGYVEPSTAIDTYEPLDSVKGDVARILFYVYMHYSNQTGGQDYGSLVGHTANISITNIVHTKANTPEAAFALLLKWNKNDPVSKEEQVRNNVAASYQGNRNPFIDNSSYADAIWGGGPIEDQVNLSIDKTTLNFDEAGESETIKATASDGGSYTVSWTSSNPSVATIPSSSTTGNYVTVSAKGDGETTITGTSIINGEEKVVSCLVKVGNPGPEPSGTITISYNDTFKPALPASNDSYNTEPTSHLDSNCSFTFVEKGIYKGSSNNYLMFVKDQGYIYNTISLGNITSISATYSSGVSTSTKTCVYFSDACLSTYKTSENVTIPGKSKTSTWTNEEENKGFFQLSTSYANCQITVISITYEESSSVPVTGVSLNNHSLSLAVEEHANLEATVTPANATDKSITWSSSDSDIASIEDGEVVGINPGSAVITVTTADGEFTDSCSVTVTAKSGLTWDLTIDSTESASSESISWVSDSANMVSIRNGSSNIACNNYYPGTEGQAYKSTRFYKNHYLTITPNSNYTINQVEFTATTSNFAQALYDSEITNATPSMNDTTVTLTPIDGDGEINVLFSANCGITGVKISATYVPTPVPPTGGKTYVRINSESELRENDEIIIVGIKNNEYYSLSTTQSANNRPANAITSEDGGNTISITDDTQIITLGVSEGYWTLGVDENQYLASDSSSKNYLRTKGVINGNARWQISINSDGAELVSKGDYTHCSLRYNSGDNLFSSYALQNTQSSPIIYKSYEVEADNWGDDFINDYTSGCLDDGYTSLNWVNAASSFNDLTSGAKDILRTIEGNSSLTADMRYQAVARYDRIIYKYGTTTFANFMSRPLTNNYHANHIINDTNSSQYMVAVIVISTLSISFALAYLYRKSKKHQ